jgi:hypothetical protein
LFSAGGRFTKTSVGFPDAFDGSSQSVSRILSATLCSRLPGVEQGRTVSSRRLPVVARSLMVISGRPSIMVSVLIDGRTNKVAHVPGHFPSRCRTVAILCQPVAFGGRLNNLIDVGVTVAALDITGMIISVTLIRDRFTSFSTSVTAVCSLIASIRRVTALGLLIALPASVVRFTQAGRWSLPHQRVSR